MMATSWSFARRVAPTTLKQLHAPVRGGRWVELRPANAAMKPLRVAADRLEIRGVLVGLVRRYA